MFIVIEFIQSYDEVYGEKNLGLFATEADAVEFVRKRKSDRDESNKLFVEYISKYVDENIHVPEEFLGKFCDVEKWWDYVDSFGLNKSFVNKSNIKDKIKELLRKGYSIPILLDFNPPPSDRNYYGYFILSVDLED